MVEANPAPEGEYEEEQKTFIDEPAILDKYKAAAVIADSKSIELIPPTILVFSQYCFYLLNRVPPEGSRTVCPWRRHRDDLWDSRCHD